MSGTKNRATRGGLLQTTKGVNISEGDALIGDAFSIARGLYPGAAVASSFGERTATAAETNVPIWPDGLTYAIPPAAGVQMSIQSTSANDAAAGTNIRSIEMHYLDGNLDVQHEVIILNGLTPVLSVATDVRFIECLHIEDIGTIPSAAGDITAENSGVIYSQIATGDTRCASSFRMVPRGTVLYVTGAVASSISGTAAARSTIRLVASELDGHQYLDPLILIPFASIGVQDNAVAMSFPIPIKFLEGTVVGMTHTSDKAAILTGTWFGQAEPVTV